MTRPELVPEVLITAYCHGIFPMADEAGRLHWMSPDPRAIIELDGLNVSRSLRSRVRRGVFEVTVNQAFDRVIDACADRPDGTWISPAIRRAYCRLHEVGYAHSVETWVDAELAGGLYGVAIGGAFFGESMFFQVTDASKVALVHLVEHMQDRRFALLDVQFMTEHLRRLGAVEVSRRAYLQRLNRAIRIPCAFDRHTTVIDTESADEIAEELKRMEDAE